MVITWTRAAHAPSQADGKLEPAHAPSQASGGRQRWAGARTNAGSCKRTHPSGLLGPSIARVDGARGLGKNCLSKKGGVRVYTSRTYSITSLSLTLGYPGHPRPTQALQGCLRQPPPPQRERCKNACARKGMGGSRGSPGDYSGRRVRVRRLLHIYVHMRVPVHMRPRLKMCFVQQGRQSDVMQNCGRERRSLHRWADEKLSFPAGPLVQLADARPRRTVQPARARPRRPLAAARAER